DLHATWRTNRAARVRGLPSEAAQARHWAESPHRERSAHPARADHPLQTRQRSAEHRLNLDSDREDSLLLTPPAFVWPTRPKFRDRVWLHLLLLVLTIGSTTLAGIGHYASFRGDFVEPTFRLP